jgi:hypothetical protein
MGKARGGKGRSTWSNLRSREHIRATDTSPAVIHQHPARGFPVPYVQGRKRQPPTLHPPVPRQQGPPTFQFTDEDSLRCAWRSTPWGFGWMGNAGRTLLAGILYTSRAPRAAVDSWSMRLAGTELSGPRPRDSILLDAISYSMEDRISRLTHAC